MSRRQRLAALTAANSADLIRAFGLPANPVARALLWPPARRFASQVQHLDDLVAAGGLPAGARWALRTFTHSLTTIGREQVPLDGPLLAVANHPGLTDAMALVVALEARPDLKIVALDRQFLRAIPAVAARLLWVADHDRVALIHAARAHLADGGALLTFPAGTIEPDPSVRPARAALADWSPSVRALARGLPGLRVLPLAVAGVISSTALAAPIVRRIANTADREYAAATLQVLLPRFRDTDTTVLVGEPFRPGPDVVTHVRAHMDRLITSLEYRYTFVSKLRDHMTATSTASVATDRPGRYAKQLVSHMSRKAQGTWNDDAGNGTIAFTNADRTLAAADGALLLALQADPENLDRMEGVVGSHLVRFGTRDELVVEWVRAGGAAGTVQRKSED
jgi:1-acyl-sn-glycerol-3-phosphate acyltransferase